MSGVKLTKSAVEAVKPLTKDQVLWDSEVKGFGCKITPKGKRVYFLYYRVNGTTQRRPVIGTHGEITAEQARAVAKRWLADIAAGGDPSRDRQAYKKAPTINDLCDRFLSDYARVRRKPGTVYDYERQIERFIRPKLGSRKVVDITRSDVSSLHHGLRDTPYQANRVLALMSKMMNLAEQWGYRDDGSNPCRHVEKYKEKKRERYLTADELGRLGQVLSDVEKSGSELLSVVPAIRLLIFTGCRMSEILTLEWDWVDFDQACIRLPDSKTGSKIVHLGEPALEVLNSIDRLAENPYVIVGGKERKHLVNLEKPWRRIRAKAGLDDVRLHDLRHTYASFGVAGNLSLPMIGEMLGHKEAATTQRYAHLAADPVKQATDQVANALHSALHGKRGN
jgi:integrase